MGHSMQKLCPLPGVIQPHQLLGEKNGNGEQRNFFLSPEDTGEGIAVTVVGARHSSFEHGLTCWSVRNTLSANSFQNVRREM